MTEKIALGISALLGILLIIAGVLLWLKSSDLTDVKKSNTSLISQLATKTQESSQLKQSLKDADDLTKALKAKEEATKAQAKLELEKIQADLVTTEQELERILSLQPRGNNICEKVENLSQDLISERLKKLNK